MIEQSPRYTITDRLAKTIHNFTTLTGTERFPVVVIEPLDLPRTNTDEIIQRESELFGFHREFDWGMFGLVPIPSPHTPIILPYSRIHTVVQEMTGNEARLLASSDRLYAHFSPCWWGPRGERADLHAVAQQKEEVKQLFIPQIAHQFENGVQLLRRLFAVEPNQAYRTIQVYGLFGHGTDAERRRHGRSRGALSLPHGHGNVDYIPFAEIPQSYVEMKKATYREIAKQIGPMDTLILQEFESDIINILAELIRQRYGEKIQGVISSDINHSIRTDKKGVAYHDGIRVILDAEIDLEDVFYILTDTIGHFEAFGQQADRLYADYYKASGDPEKQNLIRKQLAEEAFRFGFTDRDGKQMASFFLSLQPTYAQLQNWIQSLKRRQNNPRISDVEDASIANSIHRLTAKRKSYHDIYKRIKAGDTERQIRALMNIYHISSFDAEILFTMLTDRYKPRTQFKDIKHTMPCHISGSYLIDKYRVDEQGRIKVTEFTIAPKFMTEKGVLEDMAMFIVRRKEGK